MAGVPEKNSGRFCHCTGYVEEPLSAHGHGSVTEIKATRLHGSVRGAILHSVDCDWFARSWTTAALSRVSPSLLIPHVNISHQMPPYALVSSYVHTIGYKTL